MLKNFIIVATGAALITFGGGEAIQAASFEVIASGLDNPRGLTFGPDGALYVTEAGRGGTEPLITLRGQEYFYGATSQVIRIQNGIIESVVTGLPSFALADGSDATGAHDIAFDTSGNALVTLGWGGGSSSQRDSLGIPDFGNLISINKFDGGSSWKKVADLAAFENLNNPDDGAIDSNPFYFLIQDNTAVIADAGANALLGVGLDTGEIKVESVFARRLVPNPTGGPDIPMEAVPTSVAIAPDGTFNVSQLTGFPFPQYGARIYQVDGNEPEIYADGFTNIIDFTLDNNSNLLVLEYATNSILSGDPTGALIRVAPDGTRTTIASEGLISPTALAIGSDDNIYVVNNGNSAGEGEILRIKATSVSEPSSMLGLLVLGACGTVSQLWRKHKWKRNIFVGYRN
ncbi:ScyD/ScyE family protein [Chroococcidiopsis sp. CCMEE 29]|uniref:ScyD/ScyE family protein n=1 Tax=Chroococcidiopsis sp. CCMEE 29 TaxID=155894 RepID=UPI002020468F|nr:ScyD/ScyE family protein [Chroococcidiopsis sp. CCMEE 29]